MKREKASWKVVDLINMDRHEFFEIQNIQGHLRNLFSEDDEEARIALQTLVFLWNEGKRPDSLIAIIGFVVYRVKDSDVVKKLFPTLKLLQNFEVAAHLLKILAEDRTVPRKRSFMADFARYIGMNTMYCDEEQIDEFHTTILGSEWGERSKANLIDILNRY